MFGSLDISWRMRASMAATFVLVVAEAAAGLYSNSLALLSDAAHNFTDILALGLSLYALTLATRPANSAKTFGYHRAGILVAILNAATLFGIALLIFYEAYLRLINPPTVGEQLMVVVGALGFAINALTALALYRGSETDLNVRSAFVHLSGDVISTLGVVIAGIAIQFTGLDVLDPLASFLIAAIIAWSSWEILREGVHILLEGSPSGVDMDAMVQDLMQVHGVRGVHDLHAWSITSNLHALSAHVITDDVSLSQGASIQREINRVLVERYNIAHTALQLEVEGCSPDALYCALGNGDNHSHNR